MKYFVSVSMILLTFFFTSCKKDSSNPTSTGNVGGGGGNNNPVFTITQSPGNNGGIIMNASINVPVVLDSLRLVIANTSFNNFYPGDGTTVYPVNTVEPIQEFTGVTTGQLWVFKFYGKLTSSTGAKYASTSNYTVP